MYDTIIIGAGMSGLSAGIRLAHYDRKVLLLERHSVIGGLNSFYRRRGVDLDVGLHALTNYAAKNDRGGPLSKILRQLRLAWDDLSLAPQLGSAIVFPSTTLTFTNDIRHLEEEIRREFPSQIDRFRVLVASLTHYEDRTTEKAARSASSMLEEWLTDPLLREMLLCPIFYYGGVREHDLSWGEFSILFRSIFMEGLARPYAGIRLILNILADRYRKLGGELRLRCGVAALRVRENRVCEVVLEDGSQLEAKTVLSSAGFKETMRLVEGEERPPLPLQEPVISFVETISVLNSAPEKRGYPFSILFFNDSESMTYAQPDEPVDLHSGTICSPNNFAYDKPLKDNLLRISTLANYHRWAAMSPEEYKLQKLRYYDLLSESAVRFIPDFRSAVIDTDMFTPLTIERYTGHDKGAIYGNTEKLISGETKIENLFICGNDQGLVGIVGTILSGIQSANRLLQN